MCLQGGSYNFSENGIGGSGTAILSTTNGIQVNDGSAASPTHTFLSHGNTGMFLPAPESLGFSTGGTERLRISSSGNVGVGTSTPYSNLHIYESNASQVATELVTLSNPSTNGINNGSSIGFYQITGGVQYGRIRSYYSAATDWIFAMGSRNADHLVINGSGNVGIGTTTPSNQLTTTGTVQFFGITGGTLQTDAVGNVTVLSDERLKDISGEFTRGLEDIQKINPISFHWKVSTGYDTGSLYSGFSAQNIQSAIPEAVLTNSEGYLSLQDRPILAAAINAIKQLGSVFSKIENGVAYLKEVWITGPLHIDNDICVDDVCVTKQQFKQLLINSGSTSVPVPPTGGNSTGSDNNNSGATSTDVVVDPETPPDEVVTPPTEPPTPDEVVTPSAEPPTPDVVVTPPPEPVAEVTPEPTPSEGQ